MRLLVSSLALIAILGGCSFPHTDPDTAGLRRSEASVGSTTRVPQSDPVAFLVGNEPIAWSQVRPLLAETGSQIIEEIATDQVLRAQCAQLGITVTSADTAAEEKRLLERLTAATATDAITSNELLEHLRDSRALGPRRYQALLERNAMLRKLVASEITVTPEQMEQAKAVRYGPKYRGRVLITRTEREASQARAQIVAAQDPRSELVSLATSSAATSVLYPGGVVDPISAADPSYPSALRSVVAKLTPGEVSPVIALERTFAIYMLEDVIPGTTAPANDADLEKNVRAANERQAMERRAQQALSLSGVNVLDADLRWSWEHRQK